MPKVGTDSRTLALQDAHGEPLLSPDLTEFVVGNVQTYIGIGNNTI